jgi:hypothetical protein
MRRLAVTAASLATIAGVGLVAAQPGAAAGPGGVTLDAVLLGGNEVPDMGDPDGFGMATVTVNRFRKVCWDIAVRDVATLNGAHIHAGPRGVSGPVVVPLEPVTEGCTTTGRRVAALIREHPRQFYVNVHNEEFPAGALRGQLLS